MTAAQQRARADQIRDLIMLMILSVWIIYAAGAVIQLFTSGAKILDSLPPFWFWGIPLAPYSALYTPWGGMVRGLSQPAPPAPPEPPPAPPAPAPEVVQ
jgi:hypothetical protein